MNTKSDYDTNKHFGNEEEKTLNSEKKMKHAPMNIITYKNRCPINEADFILCTTLYRKSWHSRVGREWCGGTLLVPP